MVGLMGFNVDYSQAHKYDGKFWNRTGSGAISQDEFISGIKFTVSKNSNLYIVYKIKASRPIVRYSNTGDYHHD